MIAQCCEYAENHWIVHFVYCPGHMLVEMALLVVGAGCQPRIQLAVSVGVVSPCGQDFLPIWWAKAERKLGWAERKKL